MNLVGYINLVAEQENLVFLQLKVALDFGEVEHTGEVEGEIYIQVNPKEWLVAHWIELAVELLVIFIL